MPTRKRNLGKKKFTRRNYMKGGGLFSSFWDFLTSLFTSKQKQTMDVLPFENYNPNESVQASNLITQRGGRKRKGKGKKHKRKNKTQKKRKGWNYNLR
jgi:hypothetical protein